MPRVHSRLWRFLLSLTLLGGLLATPAAVSADGAVRFSEHAVNLFCDAAGPEGELHLFAGLSSEFGPFAELFADAAPVDPALGPDISGTTDQVVVVETATGATLDVTIPLVDRNENSVGSAAIHADMTLNGDVLTLEPFREGNRWIKTTGTIAFMDVTGTLDLPDPYPDFTLEFLGCGGEIVDVEVFETQPHAFVDGNEGILVDCFWESNGTFANLFAIVDTFGSYAQASQFTEEVHDWFGETSEGVSLDTTALAVEIPLFNFLTDETGTASATATLSLWGEPVTSTILSQSSRERLTQQGLLPDGTITFPTGDEFEINAENCFAATFDSNIMFNQSAGPKAGGKAPVNDTPDGALPIRIGGIVNAQTSGTALEPELQVTTCPDFDDAIGHTLWYTFTGTGDPVTLDTAGSNFDTVLAVYDEGLTELACNDDIEGEPVGITFQGALTVDTVEGATYYVQVGGYLNIFDGTAQFGRLRLRIN